MLFFRRWQNSDIIVWPIWASFCCKAPHILRYPHAVGTGVHQVLQQLWTVSTPHGMLANICCGLLHPNLCHEYAMNGRTGQHDHTHTRASCRATAVLTLDLQDPWMVLVQTGAALVAFSLWIACSLATTIISFCTLPCSLSSCASALRFAACSSSRDKRVSSSICRTAGKEAAGA